MKTILEKNSDNKISQEELEQSAIFRGMNKDDIEQDLKFEKWDSDESGHISLDEFTDFMKILMDTNRRNKATTLFDSIDRNGDTGRFESWSKINSTLFHSFVPKKVFQLDEFLSNAGALSKSALTKFGTMFHDEL